MGGHHIRDNKTCTNCGYTVDLAYCPACGQHNIETRQTFAHLFTHFVEDFTHYDTAFWKTMQNLLFKPGKLTITYLAGQRQRFVPPVKLYIFISFVTFFTLASIPSDIDEYADDTNMHTEDVPVALEKDYKGASLFDGKKYKSLAEYDSIQQSLPASERMHPIGDYVSRNLLKVFDRKSQREIIVGFKDVFLRNLPKALFIYLPIFAFWLWLLHSKKRWYFFDHGIFTLHYFAFMLLTFTISMVLDEVFLLLPDVLYDILGNLTGFVACTWIFIYFFITHKRVYRESSIISHIKSFMLFLINVFLMSVLLTIFSIFMLFSLK
ncbi:MAG TPA: DUF3667 domain-containing protein [Flavobacterium sp.]|jgi:hypothetical protein|nr:DUF3667 domain-containing protein [Flavobacterium sp.]